MVEYAIIISRSAGDWFRQLYFDQSAWLPVILVGAAVVMVLVGLLRPPKV